jgi:Subtilase family/Secretion system C-terminal sorting domain
MRNYLNQSRNSNGAGRSTKTNFETAIARNSLRFRPCKSFLILLVVLCSYNSLQAQLYYYSKQNQIVLNEDRKEFVVYLNENAALETIAPVHNALTSFQIDPISKSIICHFEVEMPVSFNATLLGIAPTDIKSQIFGHRLNDGYLLFLTNYIFAEPKTNNTSYSIMLTSLLEQYQGSFVRGSHNYQYFEFSDPLIALTVANQLYESGQARYAHPDFLLKFDFTDDPLYNDQFQMHGNAVTSGPDGFVDVDINADEAWAIETGTSDIIVAVFDDGLEAHEDFNNSNLLDGWNVFSVVATEEQLEQYDEDWELYGVCVESSQHGIPVAGIIAAQHNEIGCRGVAPSVTLLPVRINLNTQYGMIQPGLVQSFYDAADIGVAVINCSFGLFSCEFGDDVVDAAINYATVAGRNGLGTVVVVSAGNGGLDNCIYYPANNPDVIAVGAISPNGAIASYSNTGPELDIVAPSSGSLGSSAEVTTTDRMGTAGYTNNHYMDYFGGTSASAPLVTGAAALLISHNPQLTEGQVRQILYETASDLGADGWDPIYGHGNLNIGLALNALINDPCANVSGYDYINEVVMGDEVLHITENTSFQQSLAVLQGGQLIVDPYVVLSFGPDAKFIIDDGATVTLNDIILKNYCENKMWWGIEIWDDLEIEDEYIDEEGNEITVFGTPIAGGHLSISGSKIFNAHYGIAMGKQIELEDWFFEHEFEWIVINEGEENETWMAAPNPNIPRALYFAWSGGGTLNSTNNAFINCAVGIFIPGSTFGNGARPSADELFINGCDFESNGALIDPAYTLGGFDEYPNLANPYFFEANSEGRSCVGILAHGIWQYNGAGIPFQISDCSFNNLEHGIKTVNSYFDIKDNTFNNLQYGIKMAGANLNGIYVSQSDLEISGNSFTQIFDPNPSDINDVTTFPVVQDVGPWNYSIDAESSNTAAFRADNVPGIKLIDNTFGLPSPIEENFETHTNAIYLNNCSDFNVSDDNRIYYFKRGIIALDADQFLGGGGLIGTGELGEASNIIHGCEQAIITGQDNYNLLLRCNKFAQLQSEDSPDIQLWQNAGVLGHQGSEPPIENPDDNTTGAGNTFTPTEFTEYKSIIAEQIVEGGAYGYDWDDVAEEYTEAGLTEEAYDELQWSFIYYHFGNDDDLNNEHRPVPNDNLSDVEIAALFIPYDESTSCDSPYNIIGNDGDGNLITLISSSDLAEKIESEIVYLQDFNNMLNEYNTQTVAMLNAIYGGIQNEYQLRDYLREHSPLSKEVLQAYMEKSNVPTLYFAQVFELNSIVDADLTTLLEQKVVSMPAAIASYLMRISLSNGSIETTAKIQRRIAEYQKLYKRMVTNEVKALMAAGNKVDAIALLEEQQGIHPKLTLSNIYAASGDYNQAKDILHTISAPQAAQWKQLKLKQLNHLQNGTIPTRLEIKNVLTENSNSETCGQAQAMLEGIGEEFCMVIPHVDMNGTRTTTVAMTEAANDVLKIYPNPAADYFRVALPVPKGTLVQIKITDSAGRLVLHQAQITSSEDLLVEVQHLQEGNYNYHITTLDSQQAWSGNILIK